MYRRRLWRRVLRRLPGEAKLLFFEASPNTMTPGPIGPDQRIDQLDPRPAQPGLAGVSRADLERLAEAAFALAAAKRKASRDRGLQSSAEWRRETDNWPVRARFQDS
jgi:hypothetical protein